MGARLDTRAAHHRRALSRHTGLTTLPRLGRRTERHRRPMFLFARGRVGHSQRTFIVDIRTLSPSGSGHLRPRQRRRARARAARGADRLLENALQVKPAQVIGQTAPQGDSGLPPEVQHVAWTVVQQGTATPPPGSWTGDRQGIDVPTPGQQGSSWTRSTTTSTSSWTTRRDRRATSRW
jgi:hypothetical protein